MALFLRLLVILTVAGTAGIFPAQSSSAGLGLDSHASPLVFSTVSQLEFPSDFHCSGKIRVEGARLLSSPDLESSIIGVLHQEASVRILALNGEWAKVEDDEGHVGYLGKHLLEFNAHDLLEIWKKESPAPAEKKPRVRSV